MHTLSRTLPALVLSVHATLAPAQHAAPQDRNAVNSTVAKPVGMMKRLLLATTAFIALFISPVRAQMTTGSAMEDFAKSVGISANPFSPALRTAL